MRATTTYRFILRLGAKDLDIIALSETDGFAAAVKASLRSFVSGKTFSFPMPPELPRTAKTKARVDLCFYEDDEKTANFLKSVGNGSKNAVVLAIIRASLPFPVISPYLEDDGIYYDLFIRKKKRGRKKGKGLTVPSPIKEKADKTIEQNIVVKKEAPVPINAEKVQENTDISSEEVQSSANTVNNTNADVIILPSPAVPVRPSLVDAVKEEQAAEKMADEGQTEGDSTDNASGDGFDPFTMGMNMMNSF